MQPTAPPAPARALALAPDIVTLRFAARTLRRVFAVCWLVTSAQATASHSPDLPEEPYSSGWTLYADNDRLSLTESDEDYTAGFSLAISGLRARDQWLSLDGALGRINGWLGGGDFFNGETAHRYHSFGVGMAAFTPKAIDDPAPRFDQRPYACLAFMRNTRQTVVPARETNYLTSLVVGLLGTNLCEGLQAFIHDATDGIESRGWSNQIAEGGEPTLLWRGARQQLLFENPNGDYHHQVTWSVDAQLGYVTDIGAGVSWRWGHLNTPWWSFSPQHTEYAPLGQPRIPRPDRRPDALLQSYVWAGGMLRYRVFNALLQGQFRDSKVEVSSNRLEPLLVEVWLGIAQEFAHGYELTLSLRARSQEFNGPGGKGIAWGSLALSRYF